MKKRTSFFIPFSENHKNFLVFAALVAGTYLVFTEVCPFQFFLGIPSPGCGLTRAFLALAQGDIGTAFFMHPLFPVVPFIAAVILIDNPILAVLKKSEIFWFGMLVLWLLVYFIRLWLLFPFREPMLLHSDSVLFRLVEAVF